MMISIWKYVPGINIIDNLVRQDVEIIYYIMLGSSRFSASTRTIEVFRLKIFHCKEDEMQGPNLI